MTESLEQTIRDALGEHNDDNEPVTLLVSGLVEKLERVEWVRDGVMEANNHLMYERDKWKAAYGKADSELLACKNIACSWKPEKAKKKIVEFVDKSRSGMPAASLAEIRAEAFENLASELREINMALVGPKWLEGYAQSIRNNKEGE